jgi:hypothetical protein
MSMLRCTATEPFVARVDGNAMLVRPGDQHAADSAVVRAVPWAFADPEVEAATANPGEKRNIRR